MPNAQLDQFLHALLWKAGPVVILGGFAGMVLRELLRWLRRRATRFSRDVRQRTLSATAIKTPHCPSCGRTMVKRTARRGFRAGAEFWGCSNFPTCSDTRAV